MKKKEKIKAIRQLVDPPTGQMQARIFTAQRARTGNDLYNLKIYIVSSAGLYG